tara:strand:- start:12691 stop:13410 length:720 start_codon:yes stop_codon:yes gene_type:complete
MAYLSSLYIGYITPGRLGEFVKVIYLKSNRGISLSKGFSSVLIDRIFDLYLLIILGIIGLWQFDILGELTGIYFLLLIVTVGPPFLLFNKRISKKIINILFVFTIMKKIKDKVEESFQNFYDSLKELINIKLLLSVFFTFIGYSLFFLQCFIIAKALSLPIDLITITLFMSISNLISFIPISISGLGTRDATLILLFSIIGLKPELAVSYSFFIFIIFFVSGGLLGAISWWIRPLKLKV